METVRAENEGLRQQLDHEKTRVRELWRTNCQCLAEYDQLIGQQEAEIKRLKDLLATSSSRPDSPVSDASSYSTNGDHELPCTATRKPRRGKAPPVDPFTGENPEMRLDDWLPSLQRASTWNEWTDEELLLQLAGHLRGRALQEWGLLDVDSKSTYAKAVDSLRARLDPGSRTLAAQDFRHTRHEDNEPVTTYIRRLERTFQIAYGHDSMSMETRDTLLHGQLQEGLQHELMRAPAVSGAQTYRELCLTARKEKKRLAELRKLKQYQHPAKDTSKGRNTDRHVELREKKKPPVVSSGTTPQEARKCFVCRRTGHLARDCTKQTESRGRRNEPSSSKQITTGQRADDETDQSDILELLFSSDDESGGKVDVVRIPDKGNRPRCACVDVQGVPAYGVVDSGSDVTIMGGDLLHKVAAVAQLRKDLKPPNKTPRNYDSRPF